MILAAWIKFLQGKNEKGENLVINDPNKNLIKKLSNNNNQFIEKILNQRNIFDVSEEDKNIFITNIINKNKNVLFSVITFIIVSELELKLSSATSLPII